jgi:hypothetical protein
MAVELDIVRLKVARAEKHFEDFKAEVGVGANAKKVPNAAYTSVHQVEGKLVYTSIAPVPSSEARIILGDSIHQLRSALDHMVCALAMRKNARSVCEDAKLQFPIVKSARDFGADWRVSKGVYEQLLGKAELTEVEATRCSSNARTSRTASSLNSPSPTSSSQTQTASATTGAPFPCSET